MAPPTPADGVKQLRGIDVSLSEEDRARKFLRSSSYDGYGKELAQQHLELVSARSFPDGTAEAVFSMTVLPEYCNRMGNLHGGAAATIFDICTTVAVAPISREGWWKYAGVTRNLNVTYLRPAPMHSKVNVVCNIVHAGARLVTIKGEIRSAEGKVLSMAEHLKANIDPPSISKL